MSINTKGVLLVKADRVNQRIDDIAKLLLSFEKNKKSVAIEDFKDFIKSVHLIIDNEMNEKGVVRKWNH